MTQKNICLLGFSADAENKIKKIIQEHGRAFTFSWVSANNKTLDGVVINANFLEVPQIQKYISMVKKPVVCGHISGDGKKLVQQYNFYSISLSDINDIKTIIRWMGVLLGEEVEISENLVDDVIFIQKSVSSSRSKSSTSATRDSNGDILRKIHQGEMVVFRANYQDSVTWIKPAEGVVYINFPRENVPGYDQWSWEEVSESDIPSHLRQLKLDLWLFETIWRSSLDSSCYVSQTEYYRLMRWPQPLGRHGRTEALRLAATAQANPVNLSSLQQKTGYPADRILRFIFATLYAGQLEKVSNYVEQPREDITISSFKEKQREEKRSLLQRFRAKLGL